MSHFDDLDVRTLRARAGEKWQHYGSEPLAAWVADMDFPPAEAIRTRLHEMIDLGDVGYPLAQTPADLPTLFAERMDKCFGWKVEPRLVDVITEVVQGFSVGLETFSEPGEGVLIQQPIYPPFLGTTRASKRVARTSDLVRRDTRYEIDFDDLRATITKDTRIFMFCNPHNPTGKVFTRAELEQLAEIVLAHDLVVFSDEIHCELVYAPGVHIPFATLGPEIEARTITFTSASKAFNIAGLRCAFAAFGSRELKQRFNQIPRHIRGGLNALGLAATRVAWTECDDWLAQAVAYLRANRDFLCDTVERELPGVQVVPAEGTYLAWLDCRSAELAPDPFTFFLEEAKVALSQGSNFGECGESFVRINFATSRQILTEMLERMAKSLRA